MLERAANSMKHYQKPDLINIIEHYTEQKQNEYLYASPYKKSKDGDLIEYVHWQQN